jgi:Fe-S cluster assembly ATP-binding protein
MEPNERSKAGVFLSFQNIPEIKWVKLSEYLRTIFNIAEKQRQTSPQSSPQGEEVTTEQFQGLSPFMFKRFIKPHLAELQIDEAFLDRDLNVWFSGGEKRKIEILQMKLISPKYIILDEIDSGLDLDAFKTVATMLQSLSSPENSIIIITHYFTILDYIDVDRVFVMESWKIVKEGGKELVEEIKENGFGDM